ncbi:MAG: leucine--tRNA ligase, partial [Candidatus Altiarchaeales archaeon HGW-Altiarchaeales-3]
MTELNHKKIQEKWIKKWQESEIFTAIPDDAKKKFYLTVAYPYPSGSMHVGHGRTYTVPDVIARFKRMQGYNVLFPMAWHVTGSPVLGIAKRIQKNDPKTMHIYGDIYKIPEDKLKTFTEPLNIVRHFAGEYKANMTELGFSIDWSREFKTITPQYSKFIEWQYRTLKEKGLVRKGEHPVRYCPACENPVGDHDLLAGESTKINEFTILKFKFKFNVGDEEIILPAATLRPETIFGVTNMWINPGITYLKVKVNDEVWILTKEAAEKLKYQNRDLKIIDEISGKNFIGKNCIELINNKKIPILSATFVDPNYATGVVMSVPAHAPYDYIALKDLKSDIEIPIIIE